MGPRFSTRKDTYGTNHYVLDDKHILPNGESGIIAICKSEKWAERMKNALNKMEEQGVEYDV